MTYVDGYVIVIPKKNLKAYRKMAAEGGRIWKKHGALDYKECVGDDLKSVETWGGRSFLKMAKAKPNETVIFSYILYKSRKHRDEVNGKVMKDPDMHPDNHKEKDMPFKMNKMATGGFDVIVDAFK